MKWLIRLMNYLFLLRKNFPPGFIGTGTHNNDNDNINTIEQ